MDELRLEEQFMRAFTFRRFGAVDSDYQGADVRRCCIADREQRVVTQKL